MAGGTGGHIYPALAVAGVLRAQGIPLHWLGTPHGLENRLVPEAGIDLTRIRIAGLRRRGWWRLALAPVLLSVALLQALAVMLRLRPGVVLGMGGYASGPGGVAAWLCRRPLVIHEQNARAGLTNRLLARLATTVLEAFPGSFRMNADLECTGNPVRAEIAELAPPEQRGVGAGPVLRILIFGGSQGAGILNRVVPEAIARLSQQHQVQVLHQTGAAEQTLVAASYRAAGVTAEVRSYITDMAIAYATADLVIGRAGAMTVAEIAAAGVAAILVPLPAVDDHQTANARYLATHDAAILVPQAEFSTERLTEALLALAADRTRLPAMAQRARQAAKADAAERVARRCLEQLDG
jgi:UDP-N-acetylglucosamine--N-acetylmuramyl-(pentapeptide) pyrophosphoryl-undecaprenol N-acetylglucosamine transferase